MNDGSNKKTGWFWGTVATAFASLLFLAVSVVLEVQTAANRQQVETVYSNIERSVGQNQSKNDEQDLRFTRLENSVTANTTNIASLTKNVDRLTERMDKAGTRQ